MVVVGDVVGTTAVVVLFEVGLVDHAHHHALSQQEIVGLPTRAGNVDFNTLQEVNVPQVPHRTDGLLTIAIGVVEVGSLRGTGAAVIGRDVGRLVLAHVEAKLHSDVVVLPRRTVAVQR